VKSLMFGLGLLLVFAISDRVIAYDIEFDGNSTWLDYDVYVPALEIHPGHPETLRVYASWGQFGEEGIAGAEFGINGLPDCWTYELLPPTSASVVLGDPFSGRYNVGWYDCQVGVDQRVLLMTAVIHACSEVEDVFMWVVAGDPPSSLQYPFPFVNHCDVDYSVDLNTTAGFIVVNPGTVSVANESWTAIKTLFQ